jgi:hypothetical protein
MNKPFWKQWPDHKIKILASLEKRRQQIQNHNMTESAITLPEGKQLIQIFPSEIIAVKTGEKRQGNSHIFKSDNQLLCSLPLSQVMEKLPGYFIHISRFECINSKLIVMYKQSDRELIMKTGYNCIVGETYHASLMKFIAGK